MPHHRTTGAAALFALLSAPLPALAAENAQLQAVRDEIARMRADYESRI